MSWNQLFRWFDSREFTRDPNKFPSKPSVRALWNKGGVPEGWKAIEYFPAELFVMILEWRRELMLQDMLPVWRRVVICNWMFQSAKNPLETFEQVNVPEYARKIILIEFISESCITRKERQKIVDSGFLTLSQTYIIPRGIFEK